jgi:hypothetical protein
MLLEKVKGGLHPVLLEVVRGSGWGPGGGLGV